MVVEAGHLRSGGWYVWNLGRASSELQNADLTPCIFTWQRAGPRSKLFHDSPKGSNPAGSTLMTLSHADYLPKAPAPNIITLAGVEPPHMNWAPRRHKHPVPNSQLPVCGLSAPKSHCMAHSAMMGMHPASISPAGLTRC